MLLFGGSRTFDIQGYKVGSVSVTFMRGSTRAALKISGIGCKAVCTLKANFLFFPPGSKGDCCPVPGIGN